MTAGLLLTQTKDDINGRTDLYGLFVEQCRLVNPLLYGIESRLPQQRVPADDIKRLNVAVLADDGGEFDGARNTRTLGDLRVNGLRLANQLGVLHASANRDDGGTRG